MKKHNIFFAIIESFYSKSLYQDVAKNWKGKSFLYLLILLLICWIPVTFTMHYKLDRFVQVTVNPLVEQIPTVTIKKGIVSINKPVPYFIRDPQTKTIIAIIDTSGQFTDLKQSKASALLTKNKLYVRRHGTEIREYDLTQAEDMVLTTNHIHEVVNKIKHWLAVILYPGFIISSYVYRIILVLVYALIGLFIFGKVLKSKLGYQQMLSLSIIAITPPVILGTVFDTLSVTFMYQRLLYFFIAMFYLFWAIRINRGTSAEVEDDD